MGPVADGGAVSVSGHATDQLVSSFVSRNKQCGSLVESSGDLQSFSAVQMPDVCVSVSCLIICSTK